MKTVCPGCNLVCGLYIDNGNIDFRKNAPVNAGKLCKFGMKLPEYYAQPQIKSTKSKMSKAINEGSKILSSVDKSKVAYVSVGNTTCEEHLAFMELASAMSAVVNTGFGAFGDLPIGVGIPLEEIENAKNIILAFINPYEQYPLLTRRILKAKNNGANIINIGFFKNRNLASENYILNPTNYLEELLELKLNGFANGVIISDLHIHTNPEVVKILLNLAKSTNSKITFMKPFVNSSGSIILSKPDNQKSIPQILEGCISGDIKVLYLLETDLIQIMPNESKVISALENLDALIVQQSTKTPITEYANILLISERFFEKKGTVVNVEGRVIANEGISTNGIQIISNILKKLNKNALEYSDLHSKVLTSLNIKEVNEYEIPSYTKTILNLDTFEVKSETVQEKDMETSLMYLYSPFLWHGVNEYDFVELNLDTVKNLKLDKGGMVELISNNGTIRMPYKVSLDIPNNICISRSKLPININNISAIKLKKPAIT
ncbi:MAG: molybdopterin-dependent oxidoreductase [Methanosarcinales archaeon]